VVYGVVEGSAGHCGWHRGGVACRGGVVADVGRPGRADRSPVGRTGPAGPVAGPRPGPGAGRPRGADRRRWRAIADIDVLRHQAELFGPVASDTTVWRCLDEIGGAQLRRIARARATVRARMWQLIGGPPPAPAATREIGERVVVLDVDSTLLIAHSDEPVPRVEKSGDDLGGQGQTVQMALQRRPLWPPCTCRDIASGAGGYLISRPPATRRHRTKRRPAPARLQLS
jgi:hypothetical protein